MRLKLPLLLFITTLILSCSSVKKTQEAINYGNYDDAIAISLKNLRSNKTKKSNQPYVIMLEEAFKKVTEKDLNRIQFLKNDGNPSNLEEIYNLYLNLDNRQYQIKPLLPLRILDENRNAKFNFTNYSNNIISSKEELSSYLYTNAKEVLANSVNKYDFRNAFSDLNYLNKINPNYKDIDNLMEEAHFKGTDFVYVTMRNLSNKIIPIRLEKDLLNFDTYKLNDFWTEYHNKRQANLDYNYLLEINLREINISPEYVKEKEVIEQKEIIDGWEYKKDSKGEIVKDSAGNSIKLDIYKKVKCRLNTINQTKSTQVVGQIKYISIENNQLLKSFPLASEFIFENIYATYRGDKKALSKQQLGYLSNKFIPFPTNEQMVYDSGENLKERIKQIVSNYKFQ